MRVGQTLDSDLTFPKPRSQRPTFLLRRQYYRQIHKDGIRQLFESLTGLEHIIYEPLEELGLTGQAGRNKPNHIPVPQEDTYMPSQVF